MDRPAGRIQWKLFSRWLPIVIALCQAPTAHALHRYARGGAWDADASWDAEGCDGVDAPGQPVASDDVVLCPGRTIAIPCGMSASVRSITTDASWTEASSGGLVADHSECQAGQVGKLVFGGGGWNDAGARLRHFGPAATFVLKGRRIRVDTPLGVVADFDAGDDAPAARCEDGATRGSVTAATRAGDCFEVGLDGAATLDAAGWSVPKQPLVFFRTGRYRDGFARVVQTPSADRVRLAFTQPDQSYAPFAAAYATTLTAFDTANPTRVTATVATDTLPDPIACAGPCTGRPADGGGSGQLAGMCLALDGGQRLYPILGTVDGGAGADRVIFEQDAVIEPSDADGLPRAAWIAPCVRPGDVVEAWEPFVVTVATPGIDRAGIALEGDGCPTLEGVQFLKPGGIRSFSSELAGEGSDATVEFYDSYAGCTVEGPIAVDGVYFVPGGTNGPYPLMIDNVRNLTVRRFAEQGFYQNGGGDLAVPHSAKLQDCADVTIDHHSVGWLANESPWMSPLDAIDESGLGVPEGVGVELSNFNVHDVWTPPGVVDGNGGPNFADGGLDRGVNRIVLHDGMVWNVESPLVFNLWAPSSSAFVWNVVIGATHWTNDAYASGSQVALSGGSRAGAAHELLANSVIVGGISQRSAMGLGLQNWQDAYYSAIGEAVILDSFNRPIDRVRRVGMLYRQSGPTALAEYTGGGTSEALTIARYAEMDGGTPEDPNVWYRDIVVKRFCRTDGVGRGLGVQSSLPGSATTHVVVRLENLTLGVYCPEATATAAGAPSAALYFASLVDSFLEPDSSIRSVLAITGDPADPFGYWAVVGTPNGTGGPAISDVLCTRCRVGDNECAAYAAYCLSNGQSWTRDLATMHDLEGDAAALGVRAAVVDEDLTLRPDSPAWPDGDTAEHLGAGYAGLAFSFPTLADYGIRREDWSYRATPADEPDLAVLPDWLRVELGLACSDGVDSDGDGVSDFPSDPGCKSGVFDDEDPACQNGLDDDGDGKVDFDGGASHNGGMPYAAPDPECTGKAWRKTELRSCGLGVELLGVAALCRRLRRVRARRREA
jgi:hypothetical protein